MVKRGQDHLSRLRADVAFVPAFFVGTRQHQTILSRLRLGTCSLNYSKSSLSRNNEECLCGKRETVNHFSLECRLFESARVKMLADVRAIWKGEIDEELLLEGGGVKLSKEHWEIVSSAVAQYVLSTNKNI